MSGSKRKSGYRKNATKSYETSVFELEENHAIAVVLANRGSNVFEVEFPSSSVLKGHSPTLALLPNKFKNLIWIKRNDFVVIDARGVSNALVQLNVESGSQTCVDSAPEIFEIVHILNKDHIQDLKRRSLFPSEFSETTVVKSEMSVKDNNIVVEDDIIPFYKEEDSNEIADDDDHQPVCDRFGNFIN
jgi:probable RNA-binding protein EIF1AD